MKKMEQKIDGRLIEGEILNSPYQKNRQMPALLAMADVRQRECVIREVPIRLLRMHDPELNSYFMNPVNGHHPRGVPPHRAKLSSPYKPILIGCKAYDGAQVAFGVIDGFFRIGSALLTGKDCIRSYVPSDSPLLEELEKARPARVVFPERRKVSLYEHCGTQDYHFGHVTEKKAAQVIDYQIFRDGQFFKLPLSIALLRRHDPDLDQWLNATQKEHHLPLYAGYTPVIVGVTLSDDQRSWVNYLADGYKRVASALAQGNKNISAYVPEDGPLIRQLRKLKKSKQR
jgi:hypothetical protein